MLQLYVPTSSVVGLLDLAAFNQTAVIMDLLRYLRLCTIIVLNSHSCSCLAEYDIFPGFGGNENQSTTVAASSSTSGTIPGFDGSENQSTTVATSSATSGTTVKAPKKLDDEFTTTANTTASTTTTTEDPLFTKSPYKPFICPEEEIPLNIGTYEVPTQKDLAVHMKKTLLRMFRAYHKKALFFLNDISEATRATSVVENKCPSQSKSTYKLCVRHVSNQCRVITKSLVTSLERQRHDVFAFIEASICNVSSMKADPVQLIKTIAMEDASLEFALPGFLRLLGACSVYCQRNPTTTRWKKPIRHMTDQDLVIKHFLTRKNYTQLIKG